MSHETAVLQQPGVAKISVGYGGYDIVENSVTADQKHSPTENDEVAKKKSESELLLGIGVNFGLTEDTEIAIRTAFESSSLFYGKYRFAKFTNFQSALAFGFGNYKSNFEINGESYDFYETSAGWLNSLTVGKYAKVNLNPQMLWTFGSRPRTFSGGSIGLGLGDEWGVSCEYTQFHVSAPNSTFKQILFSFFWSDDLKNR